MKIAITSRGDTLDSPIDQRFGRCPCLLIVETDGMRTEAVANPYAEERGGVGSRLASLVAGRGVEVVLTGTLGPNAQEALDAAGIEAVLDCKGTVREAVDAFIAGRLKSQRAVARQPSDRDDRGGQGRGFGRGGGGGRGRGRGRGRGGGERGEGRRRRQRRFERQSGSD